MTDLDVLREQLVKMPRWAYSDLILEVDAERRAKVRRWEAEHPLRPDMSRDEFTAWIARQHFLYDKGVRRIIEFPGDAPPDEIRLIEVNALAAVPELAPIDPFDMTPDSDETPPFRVITAVVGPRRIDGVLKGEIPLPDAWRLFASRELALDADA